MGEHLTCLGKAAVAAWLLAACLSGAVLAQDASSKRDTPRGIAGAKGATGAPGAILLYEEAPGTGVIYLQESGGMLNPISEAVKAAIVVEEVPALPAAPAARPAVAAVPRAPTPPRTAPAATAAPAKLAQRRASADAAKP
jgi:hypothetical protein